MTDQEQKVCDVCRERPATHHTCYGHTGQSRDLCMTCFQQSGSPMELELIRHLERAIRNGTCKYCGTPAVGGSIGHLWCEPCSLDLVEFGSRPENAITYDFDVADEAKMERMLQQLAERERRQQEFMRQRVSAR